MALIAFAAVVVSTAWLSDDAYITFRTVDNFVNGLGLRWNPAERVQSFTHPLWMFLLSFFRLLTGELYYTSLFLSITLSVTAVAVVAFGIADNPASALLAVTILLFSRAFVDYSTSGLENPLTHLLLALFFLISTRFPLSRKTIFLSSLLAALTLLNRLDLLLILAPPLAVMVLRVNLRAHWTAVLLGFTPLIAWTLVSLLYYGTPFPNTAYAKAFSTAIPRDELALSGLNYLRNSLIWDPLTLIAIGAGSVLGLATRRSRQGPFVAGIWLYLLYLLYIGGDFMSGRFLAAPLLVAAMMVAASALPRTRRRLFLAPVMAAVLLLGFLGSYPTPTSLVARQQFFTTPEEWRDGEIADERLYYYPYTGLLNPEKQVHEWRRQGETLRREGPAVVVHGNIGFLGYFAGPDVHVIDRNALSDPLLARLPSMEGGEGRMGHFRRRVPLGYVETWESGENELRNRSLRYFYDQLTLITRGPLFDDGRLEAIWRMNTGGYGQFLERYQRWLVLSREMETGRHTLPADAVELNIPFPDAATLEGATIASMEPDNVVLLTLFWSPPASGDGVDYTVYAHVLDRAGNLIAQHDGQPAYGTRPLSSWREGELIVDHRFMRLPEDVVREEISLTVGLYDPVSGVRVMTAGGADGVVIVSGSPAP